MKREEHKVGDKAPDFTATDEKGDRIKLSDYKGKKVILYFYPRDNTPGCTAEACSLRDGYEKLVHLGYEVIGVSPDSQKSHQGFIAKYSLPFRLISDTDHRLASIYGVWGEKKMYGRTYEGIIRTTFLIDEKGYIGKVFSKVDTTNHVNQIFEYLGKS